MMDDSGNDFAHLQNQLKLARNEINNLRQEVTKFKYEYKNMCNEIMNKYQECDNSRSNQTTTQPSTSTSRLEPKNVELRCIGTIHTEFPTKRGIPRQTNVCSEAVGKLVLNSDVFTNPHHALDGLEKFSHMWILFHFHQTEATHVPAKISPPRLNGIKVGVFGTRSPHRPSPIGLSLVKINDISGNTITFNGVDMMDGTPVLDIKPFIPHYDIPSSIDYGYSSNGRTLRNSIQVNTTEEENACDHREDLSQNTEFRTLVGQESERATIPGASNNMSRRSSSYNDNPNLQMVEREAPDGEEEDSLDNANRTSQQNSMDFRDNNEIRVPRWLDNPVVDTLHVQFRMSAIVQLRQFGAEEEEKKKIIENILSQDPRSVYLRQNQRDNKFVFRMAGVYVCCSFMDHEKVVYVDKILMVDEYGPNDGNSSHT